MFRCWAIWITLLFAPVSALKAELLAGRYGGYLLLPGVGMKLAATLDTVPLKGQGNEGDKLAAYLKLSFGGFGSHEYLTHFYLVEDYDFSSDEMVLDAISAGASRDLTANTTISEQGHRISGKVSSLRGGIENAVLELKYLSPSHLDGENRGTKQYYRVNLDDLFPEAPVYPLLTGSYATEKSLVQNIQIELTKRNGLTRQSLVPMEGYVARGRLIGTGFNLELPEPVVLSSVYSFEDFLYNFYQGEISFPKRPALGNCRRLKDGIDCRGIIFRTPPEEKKLLDALASPICTSKVIPFPEPNAQWGPKITSLTSSKELSGTLYRGYLHLEERDVIRPFAVGINVTGAPVKGDPTIGKRTLTFSPRIYEIEDKWHSMNRFVPIDLPPRPVENNLELPLNLVGESGNLLEIVHWNSNVMMGVFYSDTFGRSGTFVVYRDRSIPAPKQNRLFPGTALSEIEPLDEDGKRWFQQGLHLEWVTNPSGFPEPHTLGGTFRILWNELDPLTLRNELESRPLENVRYDPYTGVLGADMSFLPMLYYYSLFVKIAEDKAHVVFSNDTPVTQYQFKHHRVRVMRKEQEYGEVEIPDAKELAKGLVHIFMPFDGVLTINGKTLREFDGTCYRSFKVDKEGSMEEELIYDIEMTPPAGRKVTHVLKLKRKDFLLRPVVVNYYELQKSLKRD